MPCYAYEGLTPVVDPTTYVHPLACLIGDVIIGPGCFIAPGASLRGDFGRIIVEGDSSLQDNVTVHASSDRDTIIRRGATIGHGAIIHGCEVGENTLIGMNAVLLDHSVIGPENLVAALALVKSEMTTPPRSLVAGNPAKVLRTFSPEKVTWKNNGGGEYQRLSRRALVSLVEAEPLPAPETDRKRLASTAIAVRLSGPAAAERERRATALENGKAE